MEEKKKKEENEAKSKKNNPVCVIILMVTLIVLFSCVAFAGGMYYYENYLNDKREEKTTIEKKDSKKETEEATELTEQEKQALDGIVSELNINFANYYNRNLTSIPNQNLLFFALKKIGFNKTISKEEIESIIRKYFGETIKVNHEPIKCNIANHEPLYNYENGTYTMNENHGGHGGSYNGGADSELNFISGSKKGNTITVDYKIAYYNHCADTCVLYALYDMVGEEKTLLYSTEKNNGAIEPLIYTDDIYSSIKDKLHITKFTFEISDEEYHLKSVSIEK